MSLYGTMRTGVSGMNAQANRLSTVGDNIANSSTVGYKKASTQFSSMILPSSNGSYNSGGVDTLWLKETGNTSYEVEIKITLVLSDSRGKRIHQESFWGQQTLRAFPSESKFSELMADALHDVAAPAAQAMSRKF